MARRRTRAASCGETEARTRLADAHAQLQLAELPGDGSSAEERKAATSCAVLAGIAATDAACCRALGVASRSENHADAVALLRQVEPGGGEAARQLDRLLAMKTESQYGFTPISHAKVTAAVRRAQALVDFAERTLQR